MSKEEQTSKNKELVNAIENELGGVEIPQDVLNQGHEAVLAYVKKMEEEAKEA